MKYRYTINEGLSKIKTRATVAVAALGLIIGGGGLSLALFSTAQASPPTVWQIAAPTTIDFSCGGGSYVHTLDTVSQGSGGNFSGTGHYNVGPSYTWNATGNVTNTNVTFTITYTGTASGTVYNSVGVIASDGSISGTTDNNCDSFAMPAGSAVLVAVSASAPSATGGVTLSNPRQQLSFEAHDNGPSSADRGNVNYTNFDANLHYNADLTCVNVTGTTAYFAYVIPSGNPYSGTWVVWKVVDGGSPGKGHDTAGFAVASNAANATSLCESGAFTPTPYTITAGNLVVH